MTKWYETEAQWSEIILASGVRLVRNWEEIPFSTRMTAEQAAELVRRVAARQTELEKVCGLPMEVVSIDSKQAAERGALCEQGLVDEAFLQQERETLLLVSEDERLCVAVGGEEHISVQSFALGERAAAAWLLAEQAERVLEESLHFSYHDRYGYLTCNPMCVGSGLHVRYWLFLPALTYAGKIGRLTQELGKYGVSLQPLFEENGKSLCTVYCLQNLRTIGLTEEELLDHLARLAAQTVKQEQKRRDYLRKAGYEDLEDRVYRAYGILKYAKKLNLPDALRLLAQVKFGFDMGLLKQTGQTDIGRLLLYVQPNLLQIQCGRLAGSQERDIARAAFVRSALPEL